MSSRCENKLSLNILLSHSRSLKVIRNDNCRNLDTVSHSHFIVTMVLSYVIFQIKLDSFRKSQLFHTYNYAISRVVSGSFSVSKDFADTDIQTMIDALCTA